MKKKEIVIPRAVFNEVYLPLLESEKKYVVLCGGAGSGKSVFAVQRYLWRLLKEKRNLLVIRAVAATHRDSTFALFKQIIGKWGLGELFSVSESTARIRCENGSEIVFKGLDNSEKLKSVTFAGGELTDIWIEEASEIAESDFNQLVIRLRGGKQKKQVVLTFNPVSIEHWLKRRFFDQVREDAVTLRTTYKDNRFLAKEDGEELERFKESDPYYYSVYCLGEWGVTGKSVFHAQKVSARLHAVRSVRVKRGIFAAQEENERLGRIRFLPEEDGPTAIYEEPIPGKRYVIGADTSGDGTDWFVAQVIERVSGRQVAVLRQQCDEDIFVRQLYCLGIYYNEALIACEVNFSTYPVRELQRLHYPRQYYRESFDSITRETEYRYGFVTNRITRPVILAELIKIVREQPALFTDAVTLEEMLTFTRNAHGRAEAARGAHDDCVMALAIALAARTQGG